MNEVVEKIKKLLALATSANEHEARLAAEKAGELLLRYNLRAQDIEADLDYAGDDIFEGPRLQTHSRYVIDILCRHFFVEIIERPYTKIVWRDGWPERRRRLRLFMVGSDTNLAVGKYIYVFLDRIFPELWRKYHRLNRRSRAENYYAGLHYGLDEQLGFARRRVENDTGLVVAGDPNLPGAVRRLVGNTVKEQQRNNARPSRAMNAGYRDGKNLKIRSALDGDKSESVGVLLSGARR
jgi:hypothetical protein